MKHTDDILVYLCTVEPSHGQFSMLEYASDLWNLGYYLDLNTLALYRRIGG